MQPAINTTHFHTWSEIYKKCQKLSGCTVSQILQFLTLKLCGYWSRVESRVKKIITSNPKPSLKIRTASAIFWIYLVIFSDYSLKNIFLGITIFVFQERKLKLSASVWNPILLSLTKFQPIQLIQTIVIFNFFYWLSDWVEILWGFTKFFF